MQHVLYFMHTINGELFVDVYQLELIVLHIIKDPKEKGNVYSSNILSILYDCT